MQVCPQMVAKWVSKLPMKATKLSRSTPSIGARRFISRDRQSTPGASPRCESRDFRLFLNRKFYARKKRKADDDLARSGHPAQDSTDSMDGCSTGKSNCAADAFIQSYLAYT